jgi:predicted short-subunit dehydrogenase-like oxidoreductase (DUF2520 family)
MIDIVILGTGNVAVHLCKAMQSSDKISVIQVFGRTKSSLMNIPKEIDTTVNLSDIKEAQIYIIAITDDAIKNFSKQLPVRNTLVVHTSGSVPMDDLESINRKGVFYPLQTFSKDRELDFRTIPVCLEAEYDEDLELLKEVAYSISDHVELIDSENRARLHLAAVFVNNFVNHMYRVAYDILAEESLSFDLLKPLIIETANKIELMSPSEAQTGPAKRHDIKTMENHLHLLKNLSDKEIYRMLSTIISKSYGKEL